MTSLLRDRLAGHARVGYAELLFDLVFVYAVTQLSHALLDASSIADVFGTGILFLGVWWVWNYTAWVTNWLDPDVAPVRLMLFALMAAGLVLSMSIPSAYAAGGLTFAAAYVAMQLGRSIYMWRVLRGPSPDNARNFARITAWFTLSGILWLAGGFLPVTRLPLWAAAVLIEYGAPLLAFRVPGLGAAETSTWDVESAHLSERCALFIIIALGEVIVMTGGTFASHGHSVSATVAFAAAFVSTIACWWLYFAAAADDASARFAAAANVGAMARSAYTFLHVPIVAGIIVFAAGVEQLLAHSEGHVDASSAAALAGGPLLFLAGLGGFRAVTGLRVPIVHLMIAGALLCTAVIAGWMPPAVFAAIIASLLAILAAGERRPKS